MRTLRTMLNPVSTAATEWWCHSSLRRLVLPRQQHAPCSGAGEPSTDGRARPRGLTIGPVVIVTLPPTRRVGNSRRPARVRSTSGSPRAGAHAASPGPAAGRCSPQPGSSLGIAPPPPEPSGAEVCMR